MAETLVLTGATATGKTALSLAVAEAIGAEIVSMDSRQVYRHMDIGTAKATPAERARVPHHLVDIVDPDERYSAGKFARDARAVIAALRSRNVEPLLVGGTGFFLRALTHPLFAQPELDASSRQRLGAFLSGLSNSELARWLGALDPALSERFAARAGGVGRQRLARALEVALLTGRPLSWWHAHAPSPEAPLDVRVFVLSRPLDELHRRTDARVWDMVNDGLPAEVDRLLGMGYDTDDPGMNATGYPEMIAHLRGHLTLPQAVDEIQRATWRYARRQLTWFRRQLPANAVWLDATRTTGDLVDEIVRTWRRTTAR